MYYDSEEIYVNGIRLVIITFRDTPRLGIGPQGTFDELLQLWIQYYERKQPFHFLFETRFMENLPPITYCFKMALFIYNLKKRPFHYLKRSTIIIKRTGISRLLDMIFAIQSPVAPVLVYRVQDTISNYHSLATCNLQHLVLTKDMKVIYP